YYHCFRRHLLNHSHAVMALEEALSQVGEIFARFGSEGRVFVRPCGVQKTFTGRCTDREGFVLALESARYAQEPVLVAFPQEIAREWRVVIARGGFIAAGQYKSEGHHPVLPRRPPDRGTYVDGL